MNKQALRQVMRQRRVAWAPSLGVRMAGHVLTAGIIKPGAIIGAFWPLADEIDCRAAMLALFGQGYVIGLPVTPPRGQALSFRRWRPGMALQAGRFGTAESTGEEVSPSILLVPLLAFDRFGWRLGYGGGYYDRTLARLGPDVCAIGCGFAAQEVDRVPTETHDRKLDAVATEAGVIGKE